jgi:sortase A
MIVLNGAYGRTLAFGPGLAESSAVPGTGGTTILAGHRDTHFSFLQDVKETTEILFDLPDGRSARYRVRGHRVVDARTDSIRLADDTDQLVLITCYPFDAIFPGGPLRYLVRATRVAPPP